MASLFILMALSVLLGAEIMIPIETQLLPGLPVICPIGQWYDDCSWTDAKETIVRYECDKREYCTKRCRCNGDKVKKNGVCVSPGACDCKDNEEYKENNNNCQKYCDTSKNDLNCTTSGCFCKSGYRRLDNGTCVPFKNCPCPENEEYKVDVCDNFCGQTTNPLSCNYTTGCQCKIVNEYIILNPLPPLGIPVPILTPIQYRRNLNGTCINPKYCPCSQNETYKVNNYCEKYCDALGTSDDDRTNCTTRSRCFCKDGYRRDTSGGTSGYCVQESECPAHTTCNINSDNEVYVGCVIDHCAEEKRCSDIDREMTCPNETLACTGGCLCEQGYLRVGSGNATCIQREQC